VGSAERQFGLWPQGVTLAGCAHLCPGDLAAIKAARVSEWMVPDAPHLGEQRA